MRTVHRLMMIIAIVVGSLYAAKDVAAAEVDIIFTNASCDGGRVILDYQVTNNSSMSVTISFLTFTLGTVDANSTATGTLPTPATKFLGATLDIPFTRQDGTTGTTPVTLPIIDCTQLIEFKVYLPLIYGGS